MDFLTFAQAPEEDSSHHSDQCSYLPAYLRAPEVTSAVRMARLSPGALKRAISPAPFAK